MKHLKHSSIAAFVLATVAGVTPHGAGAGDQLSSSPFAIVEGYAVVTDGPVPAWGLSSSSVLALTAWDAQPIGSTTTYDFFLSAGGQGIFRTAGDPWFKIPVQLPTGALLTQIEFNYCDTGAGTFSAFLFRQPKNAAPTSTTLLTSTGTSGCVVQTATLATPQTIDNNANSYHIELNMGATANTIVFLSARVFYQLQVSPPPATATFNDVPTSHPFFQFVEALAAAGITSGCGGGNFCPDAPLTRGAMAVFLSEALGLHWPN